VNKPTVENDDGEILIPGHLILGNGTQSERSLMIDYRHTDSAQSNPLDFSAHMTKSGDEKLGKYNTVVSRSGHRFMPIILDKFGNVLQKTKDIMHQMFLRKVSNDRHDITETEADLLLQRSLFFG